MTNGNDGAYYRMWISLFMFMFMLLLRCCVCEFNPMSVRRRIPLESRQTDEFGNDFNGLSFQRIVCLSTNPSFEKSRRCGHLK